MQPKHFLIFACLFIFSGLSAQHKLFTYNGMFSAPPENIVVKGTRLKLDRNLLVTLNREQPAAVRISIPIENEIVVLNLTRAELFRKNFEVIVSNTLETFDYTPGYYLRGKIEGELSSLVAISIFNDYAGGVISYRGHNYNLVLAGNENDHLNDNYLLYADKDCLAELPKCMVEDDGVPVVIGRPAPTNSFVGCPVDIYFETGFDMYEDLGNSVQNVMNYLTTLFNIEQTLYNNENILVQLREVKVWTTIDPEYNYTNTTDALNSFRNRMNTTGFNGDLAHYVTFHLLGGGRGALDALCYASPGSRTSVSGNLKINYAPYPNYSFSVNVITHENGHNLGSPHTHSCTWPGGAIDNCYATVGGCPLGVQPTNGGTIMSYCHTNFSIGINFANGFGPLPGDFIRTKVADASTAGCICDCGDIQLDVTKQDIGCGNPTGSASAAVTGGTGPYNYLWSNGATTASVTGLAVGTYYVKVSGAVPNCTVIKGFKIASSGNVTTVTLDPVATTITKCLNESFTISSTVAPSGTYTYQWYKNNVAIPGATNSSLLINSAVANTSTYYLIANGGTCLGQSTTTTVIFQAVSVPVITANSATAICQGQSVTLSIPASSFSTEWRLNGVPISGATNSTYTATAAGTYTVRNYSSTTATCSALSAPITVTIKPLPNANTTPASISFCSGEQSVITHPSVPNETYSWYKDNVVITGQTSNTLTVTTSGNYQLRVTGGNGCIGLGPVTSVAANPLPAVQINPAGTVTLCDGGSLTLQAVALNQAQFSWYNGTQLISSGPNATLNVTQSGSYSVKITNTVTGCTKTSASTDVSITPPPAIFAGNDTTIATGQQYRLHASELTSIGVDHYEWTPATGLSNPSISNPTVTLYQSQEYTVKGVYPSGCVATDKVLIKVVKGPAIYVPAAFSPNDDSKNDVLLCTAVGLSAFKYFDIFNRYGQRIFHSTNLLYGWDGKWNGARTGIETYVYVAEGVDYKGKPVLSKGTVTVVY